MSNAEDKELQLINEFKIHDKDTGSTTVQVVLLTKRINDLIEHFKLHKKDHNSRRGLLKLINRRKKFLSYLQKTNEQKYQEILKKLQLRK